MITTSNANMLIIIKSSEIANNHQDYTWITQGLLILRIASMMKIMLITPIRIELHSPADKQLASDLLTRFKAP